MGPKKLKRLTLGQNASKCIHRIHINLTATNKSHTDQGLLFSEPKSGVFFDLRLQSVPSEIIFLKCGAKILPRNHKNGLC